MAYVVTEACIKCKYTDCVTVCPVDCFREAELMLVIDPDVCIDCNACVPVCPSEAIFAQVDLPPHWRHYVEINARQARALKPITRQKKPLPDADAWKKPGKGSWGKIGDKDAFLK